MGSEVLMSYMPLGMPLEERQERLREEYGFACDCTRCGLEEVEEEEEEEEEAREEKGNCCEGGSCCEGEKGEAVVEQGRAAKVPKKEEEEEATTAEGVDETYVALFVLKHVCAVCMGTMAPLAGRSSSCICNRCGVTRTEAQFLERVEQHFSEEHEHD